MDIFAVSLAVCRYDMMSGPDKGIDILTIVLTVTNLKMTFFKDAMAAKTF